MSDAPPVPNYRPRAVRLWLLVVAAMIFTTLVIGGATRLTVSGLSIVEWKPVTGALPPLSQSDWQNQFTNYQATPQYQHLNRGMSLGDFKVIYWWEWSHRQLARTTGAVYLLPFLFFLARGWIPKSLRPRLWGILALFGLLATVGWWMVASGLTGTRVAVSPYWLAFHLTLASTLYLAVVWTAQQLESRAPSEAPWRWRNVALTIAVLVLLQIYLGALVAGNNAGQVFNTWPLIDGALIPSAERLWFIAPVWRNLFENTLTVQFDHRMMAYAIWLLALFQARTMRRDIGAVVLAVAVTLQAALGIVTLLHQVPLHLALSHQLLAIVVFTIAIAHVEKLWHRAPV